MKRERWGAILYNDVSMILVANTERPISEKGPLHHLQEEGKTDEGKEVKVCRSIQASLESGREELS